MSISEMFIEHSNLGECGNTSSSQYVHTCYSNECSQGKAPYHAMPQHSSHTLLLISNRINSRNYHKNAEGNCFQFHFLVCINLNFVVHFKPSFRGPI